MRLEIFLSPDEKPFRSGPSGGGYDWRYSLRLDAGLAGSERLSTAAICEWNDTFVDRIMPALSCYIDCDGGSVTVWRKIGRSAVTVKFEAGERLKTGGSCGGGGAVFMGAEREARSLPVQYSITKCSALTDLTPPARARLVRPRASSPAPSPGLPPASAAPSTKTPAPSRAPAPTTTIMPPITLRAWRLLAALACRRLQRPSAARRRRCKTIIKIGQKHSAHASIVASMTSLPWRRILGGLDDEDGVFAPGR